MLVIKNKILKLFILLNILNFIYSAEYFYTYDDTKNVFTFTGVMNFQLLRLDLLDSKNKVTSSINFNCISTKNRFVCTSEKLDPNKLISFKTSYYAKEVKTGKTLEKNDGLFPPIVPTSFNMAQPSTSGGKTLVSGQFLRLGFGDTSYLPAIINGKAQNLEILNSTAYSATSFEVMVPPGSGSIVVKLGDYTFTQYYSSPFIMGVMGNVGDYYVSGRNFFIDPVQTILKVNGVDISSTITRVENENIYFNYIPKISQKALISVIINTRPSNEQAWLIPPYLDSYSGAILKNSGGVLTISGKCLQGSKGDQSSVAVLVGSLKCENAKLLNESCITCDLPKPNGDQISKLVVAVSIDGISQSANEPLLFSYDVIPTLSTYEQNETLFTLFGTNLGLENTEIIVSYNSDISIKDGITYSQDESSLSFKLPINMTLNNVKVKTSYGESNKIVINPTPVIDAASTIPPTKGGKLIFSGAYIDFSSVPSTKVSFENPDSGNIVNCPNVEIDQEKGTLSCDAPIGTGKLIALIVIGKYAIKPIPFSYQQPSNIQIKSQTNYNLDIQGDNFGYNSTLVSLKIKDSISKAKVLRVLDDKSLATFTIPHDIASNDDAIIIVDDIGSDSFKIQLKPVFKSIDKSNTEGNHLVYIYGSFFDSSSSYKISLGGSFINAKYENSTTLSFLSPKGSGTNIKVSIEYNNSTLDSGNLSFHYNAPTIISSKGVSFKTGGSVTITGTNFDQINSFVVINNRNCSNVKVQSSTIITCDLAPSFDNIQPTKGTKYPIIVTVNGQSTQNNNYEYSYDPIITKSPSPTKNAESSSGENNSSNMIIHSISLIIISIVLIFII